MRWSWPVLGKDGKDIPAEEAYDYIFTTIVNDVSARDI